MIQYARYIPIILELLKQGQNAKEIVSNFGKSNSKLKDLEYLSKTGISASKILQDLFTDTEKDKEKYPEEIFQSKFGDYLKSIDLKSRKDFKNAVKNIASVGLVAYSLSGLGKKYPLPNVEIEYQKPQTLELPPPGEPIRPEEGETIISPMSSYQRAQAMQRAAAEGDIEELDRLRGEKTFKSKQPIIREGTARAERKIDVNLVNPFDPSTFRKKTPLDLLKEEPLGLPAPEMPKKPSKGQIVVPPRTRRDIALQKLRAARSGDEEQLAEARSLQPTTRIDKPIPYSIGTAEPKPSVGPYIDLMKPSTFEQQPSAPSIQPTKSQPTADSIQQTAPLEQTVSQAILFDTEIYKKRSGNSKALLRVIKQGFDNDQIISFAKKYLGKRDKPGLAIQNDYIDEFEEETGKKFKDEIEDLRNYFKAGGDIPKAKPKQLFTSKEDKELQDSGLKPKLKPTRKKQQISDFMKQVQESARPTESLAAPTDRQATMNTILELQNLVRGS